MKNTKGLLMDGSWENNISSPLKAPRNIYPSLFTSWQTGQISRLVFLKEVAI